jgi:hypothetical protein
LLHRLHGLGRCDGLDRLSLHRGLLRYNGGWARLAYLHILKLLLDLCDLWDLYRRRCLLNR